MRYITGLYAGRSGEKEFGERWRWRLAWRVDLPEEDWPRRRTGVCVCVRVSDSR